MNLVQRIKQAFAKSPEVEAATLPPQPVPKAPKGGQSLPGYRTQVTARTSSVAKPNTAMATLDRVANAKSASDNYNTIKRLRQTSPELGSAASLKIRTAIPDDYVVIARNMDGQVDRAATELAHELLRRVTYMGSADGSFGAQQGLQSLSETLALDLLDTGAIGLEVALDKQRIPASFNPVAVNTLVVYEEDNSFRLVQKVGGVEIDLDIPTFIYAAIDQTVTDAYPTSPLQPAVQAVLNDLDFNNDMRRALKRAVLPRLTAVVDSEEFKKLTPPEILADAEKFSAYQNDVISQISTTINGLNPEDALISFDFIKYAYIDGGHDPSAVIERVQKVLNAKLVSGTRGMPVTMGFASSSNASSAESLLFLKECEGIRKKLNEVYSRALTVAIRIMGVDGFVEFKYGSLNLRPEAELEAFKSMKQSRILELLSFGFVTDDEAGLELTGHLPPTTMPKLSGTMFTVKKVSTENPASNTANGTERTLQPDTPTSASGA